MIKILLINFVLIFILNLNYYFIFNILFIIMLLILLFNNFNLLIINYYNLVVSDIVTFFLRILLVYIILLILIIKVLKIKKIYKFIILFLIINLLIFFNIRNYFIFYLFFEISLLPTFFLVIGWGYQPERINASLYILFYTLFASLPLLILLFKLFNYHGSLVFYFLMIKKNLIEIEVLIYFFIVFAFLIKLPMYLIHAWLPKAHVEAPVSGSMILAGVILKIGGYGIYRVIYIIVNLSNKLNLYLIILSLIGIFNLRLVCLRQLDIKSLVAFSSVVHIILILIGLIIMNIISLLGGILLIISHGICSSALFYLVNLNYKKVKSRNIYIIKGIILIIPSLSIWWFIFCIINISAPPRINLFSEILIINCILNWRLIIILVFALVMLLRIIYRLYLFSYNQHGFYNLNYKNFNFINVNNYLNLFIHWFPLFFFFLKFNFLI